MNKLLVATIAGLLTCGYGLKAAEEADIIIYGSSPAAISAAVQAKRMGKTAIIVSPEKRIGGLTTGGLGQTDIGNKKAFGGIALEFYRAVSDYYKDKNHWKWQQREDFIPEEQNVPDEAASKASKLDSMWLFEPHAALEILEGWEKRDGLVIHRGKRLDRAPGRVIVEAKAKGEGGRIAAFFTEDGVEYRGKMFVDATYEGDLMAAAGVTYFVGREDVRLYGENLGGVNRRCARAHQLSTGVDPYVVKGDKTSGFLPGIEGYDMGAADGTGDRRVQAYNIRMCLTDVPENRIPFKKPAGYDERDYELLFRNYEAHRAAGRTKFTAEWQYEGIPFINSLMPNRKTDTNNRGGFSTDFIGQNWSWPEASYAEREKIFRAHLKYQQGLMWTLANHPRIPEGVRAYMSKWGTTKDEFTDGAGDGWQTQLYVREARRLVGDYVMTENHCWGKLKAARPIAMGAYQMDSHHVRRYVGADGCVHNEGDVEEGWQQLAGNPYGVDYGAIIPKKAECVNLFVPVCMSATHMAFGSIRKEPVFFALGQAAGTAAAQAIDAKCAVQDLAYAPLAARLEKDGQVIRVAPKAPAKK